MHFLNIYKDLPIKMFDQQQWDRLVAQYTALKPASQRDRDQQIALAAKLRAMHNISNDIDAVRFMPLLWH